MTETASCPNCGATGADPDQQCPGCGQSTTTLPSLATLSRRDAGGDAVLLAGALPSLVTSSAREQSNAPLEHFESLPVVQTAATAAPQTAVPLVPLVLTPDGAGVPADRSEDATPVPVAADAASVEGVGPRGWSVRPSPAEAMVSPLPSSAAATAARPVAPPWTPPRAHSRGRGVLALRVTVAVAVLIVGGVVSGRLPLAFLLHHHTLSTPADVAGLPRLSEPQLDSVTAGIASTLHDQGADQSVVAYYGNGPDPGGFLIAAQGPNASRSFGRDQLMRSMSDQATAHGATVDSAGSRDIVVDSQTYVCAPITAGAGAGVTVITFCFWSHDDVVGGWASFGSTDLAATAAAADQARLAAGG